MKYNFVNYFDWKKNRTIVLIVFCSLIISLLYSFVYRIEPSVDARAYDTIALNVLSGNGFKEYAHLSYEFDPGMLRAGPGYEFFLAGIYWIFGHHYEVVWIIQALLHALTAWLVYKCARLIFSEQSEIIGLISAGFIGFHPDLIEISAMLMTETLYLFLTVLVLLVFLRSYASVKNYGLALLLGTLTGLSILTRPPLLLFVLVFIFLYVHKKAWKSLAFFIIGLVGALAPWAIRNYIIYHQLILTTLIGPFNIWVGNTVVADGGQLAGGFNPVITFVSEQGIYGLNAKANHEFVNFLLHHPFIFIKLCVLRLVRYFSLIRPMGFWFYQTGWSQLVFIMASGLSISALFISGFSGLVLATKKKTELLNYVIVLSLSAPLLLLPTVVQSRYRFQIYPFLALFAGYAWVEWKSNRLLAKKTVLWVACALGIISLIDLSLYLPIVFVRLQSIF